MKTLKEQIIEILTGTSIAFKEEDLPDIFEQADQILSLLKEEKKKWEREIIHICNVDLQKDWQGKKTNKIYNQALVDLLKKLKE